MAATVTKLIEKKQTEKAFQFTQVGRDGREGSPFWIPKSQIDTRSKFHDSTEIKIPGWLAAKLEKEHGINYYE